MQPIKLFLCCSLMCISVLTSCNQKEPQGYVATLPASASLDGQSPIVKPTTIETSIPANEVTVTNSSLPTIAITPQFEKYHGRSGYGSAYPDFEIWYDQTIWEYVPDPYYPDDASELVNIKEPNCSIRLQSGATDAVMLSPIDIDIEIAGRWWHYKLMSLISNAKLSYSTDYGYIVYIFDVSLPEAYDEQHKSECQYLAEAVLETFTIIDSIPR